MKRKTDNFNKFYNKKNNAAIKEAIRQEKKAAKKERKEAIERHFEEKRQARANQFEAAEELKKLPGKKKPPTAGPVSKSAPTGRPAKAPAGLSAKAPRTEANPKAKHAPAGQSPNHDPDLIPLNKYIAHGGVCSRRDAAELIRQGKVQVNGQLIVEPGTKVSPNDVVKFNGKQITISRNFVYILLNKPKDYITTTDDPQGRKTVLDLIRNATTERVFPVGRLDRNTSGVLLLTNDGDLAQKLAHPRHEIKKIYHVTLDKPLTKADFDQIATGVELEDGLAHVDVVAYADIKDKTQIGLEIHSGKNRIVRRIFEHLGYDVRGLDRVTYAGLTKKNVQRGHWRLLTEKEIRILKYLNSSFRGSLAAPKSKAIEPDEDEDFSAVPAKEKPAPKKFVGKKFSRPDTAADGSKKFSRPGPSADGAKKFSRSGPSADAKKFNRPGPSAGSDKPRAPKSHFGKGKSKGASGESPRGRKSSGSYNKSKFTSRGSK